MLPSWRCHSESEHGFIRSTWDGQTSSKIITIPVPSPPPAIHRLLLCAGRKRKFRPSRAFYYPASVSVSVCQQLWPHRSLPVAFTIHHDHLVLAARVLINLRIDVMNIHPSTFQQSLSFYLLAGLNVEQVLSVLHLCILWRVFAARLKRIPSGYTLHFVFVVCFHSIRRRVIVVTQPLSAVLAINTNSVLKGRASVVIC